MSHSMTQEATNTRHRWGLSCGCLVVVGGALLTCFIFLILSLRTDPTVTRNQVVADATAVYGEARLSPSDVGISEVIKAFVTARVPEIEKVWKPDVAAFVVNPQGLVIIDETSPGAWEFYGAIQPANALSRFFMRSLFERLSGGAGKFQVRTDGGAKVYATAGSQFAYAVGTRLVAFGNNSARLVKLVNAPKTSAALDTVTNAEMLVALGQLDADKAGVTDDLSVIIANRNGRVESLFKWLETVTGAKGLESSVASGLRAANVDVASMGWLRLSADVQTADRVVFELVAPCADGTQAAAVAAVFAKVVPELFPEALKLKVTPEASVRGGNRAVVRTTVDGILQFAKK